MIHALPTIHVGDCLEWLRTLPTNSVDAIVTDPPYGLGREPDPREVLRAWLDGEEYKPSGSGFMGRAWDAFVPSPPVWAECLRVLKPGGHLLAFAGTRTYDWIVMGVRLAGFEVRDMIGWLYGSGFPKSLDVSKAIDGMMGVEREVVGEYSDNGRRSPKHQSTHAKWEGDAMVKITAPATEAARQWSGFGTALKPACEPVVMARKPLDGTVAQNVMKWGTGAINVDGCRVGTEEVSTTGRTPSNESGRTIGGAWSGNVDTSPRSGRWPANIIHDGSDEVLGVFPPDRPGAVSNGRKGVPGTCYSARGARAQAEGYADSGNAARFFYAAKASRTEREHGLGNLPRGIVDPSRELDSAGRDNPRAGAGRSGEGRANIHPTVKPVDLMRYLIRLVTPPGGLVLDPYAGSGTTGVAAVHEGVRFAGAELDTAHALIAVTRIAQAATDVAEAQAAQSAQLDLFSM
jgi:site-specific DNA-methyltransferase (adenine-specific)